MGSGEQHQPGVGLKRVSSRRDGMLVAGWASSFGIYVALNLRLGTDTWISTYGLLVIGAWILLGILVKAVQARVRTVRPRHYGLVEGCAVLWGAIGASVASLQLQNDDGTPVGLGVTLLAALVVSAPTFGCALWLMVRGR